MKLNKETISNFYAYSDNELNKFKGGAYDESIEYSCLGYSCACATSQCGGGSGYQSHHMGACVNYSDCYCTWVEGHATVCGCSMTGD